MLRWSATFLIIALLAGGLGFYGVAGAAAGIAKILFMCFLALFVITGVAALAAGNRLTHHGPRHLH